MDQNNQSPRNTAYYRRILNSAPDIESHHASLESMAEDQLSDNEINDRMGYSEESLNRIIEQYLDNDPALKNIAAQIARNSKDALAVVAADDDQYLDDHQELHGFLEVIVSTDGSRPSFMIRNGEIDLATSPVGEWRDQLSSSKEEIRHAIACTGRVNVGLRQKGSGFLVGDNHIITNRHVLQSIAMEEEGKWRFAEGAHIDFGHEFKARASVNPRALKKVVFFGPDWIDVNAVDHRKSDFVLIEIEAVSNDMIPANIIKWNDTSDWCMPDNILFTIGYPGPPAGISTYPSTLLEQLFQRTYGCKRFSPGRVINAPNPEYRLRMSHDATTLGGNSGSLIVAGDNASMASGVHYGGDLRQPRENWGQVLASAGNVVNRENAKLAEVLEQLKIIKRDPSI